MKQGIQAELPDSELREYGCYFICLLAIAEKWRGSAISPAEIVGIRNFSQEQGWVGTECYVIRPDQILKYAGKAAETPAVLKKDEPPLQGDYIVCNKKPMYTHFTAVIGGEPWDPLPPLRPGAKAYRPDNYRVFYRGIA